jgi:FrsA-like alpha/beta hydrolase family protein
MLLWESGETGGHNSTVRRHLTTMNSPPHFQQRGPQPESLRTDPRQIRALLRQAYWGAADREQVLATQERIEDDDPDSWMLEWIWTAGQAWASGNALTTARRTADAGRAYLHAATYYGAALSQLPWSSERDRWPAVWRRHRECWQHALAQLPIAARQLELPYGDGTLPAYLFPAPGATGRRPLVIVHNGATAPTSAMWGHGGAAAHERGYHWLTFDGPGQQSAFFERGQLFRPDWEAVLTAVIDAVSELPQVDPRRIAAVGVGQAGYWLPRALQHEHRCSAVAVNPGIVDVLAAWEPILGDRLLALHRSGQLSAYDRELHASLLFAPRRALQLQAWAAPYGHHPQTSSRLLTELSHYRLDASLHAIRTPLLVLETGEQTPWPGQSRELLQRIPTAASILTTPDPIIATGQTFDWLEPILSG